MHACVHVGAWGHGWGSSVRHIAREGGRLRWEHQANENSGGAWCCCSAACFVIACHISGQSTAGSIAACHSAVHTAACLVLRCQAFYFLEQHSATVCCRSASAAAGSLIGSCPAVSPALPGPAPLKAPPWNTAAGALMAYSPRQHCVWGLVFSVSRFVLFRAS